MKNNPWFKLAGVSLAGIVVSYGILWGAQQVNQYKYYNNNGYGVQMQMNGNMGSMQMPGYENNQSNMNMQGGMNNMNNMNSQGSSGMQGGMGMMQMNNMSQGSGMGMGMMGGM